MINFFQILSQSSDDEKSAKYTQMCRRIEKASQMTSNGFSLWGELTADTAMGVIKSQTDQNKYYYSFIRADGTYGCFDNMLAPCLGQPLYFSIIREDNGEIVIIIGVITITLKKN